MAKRLIDIYFTLFKMILEGHIGRAAAAVKLQEAKLPAKSKDRHRDRQAHSVSANSNQTVQQGTNNVDKRHDRSLLRTLCTCCLAVTAVLQECTQNDTISCQKLRLLLRAACLCLHPYLHLKYVWKVTASMNH